MAELQTASPLYARELLWIYNGVEEEQEEQSFFTDLHPHVAEELTRRFQTDERLWVGREVFLSIGSYRVHARLTNIEPLLATGINEYTKFIAQYRAHSKDQGQNTSALISEVIRYPNDYSNMVFESLVGLDTIKRDLVRKLNLLLKPKALSDWLQATFQPQPPKTFSQLLQDRYPLFILEGEVGAGKSALARSVGSRVALRIESDIALFVVNAQVRGGGHVGELSQNISHAFAEAERCQEREQIPVIILIDEADGLAQARGGNQTHHEDDAGVNTLIQRIDRLRGRSVAVFFATNLVQSLDSAILRRAYATYHFDRPRRSQRIELFKRVLGPLHYHEELFGELAQMTAPRSLPGFETQVHRYTYSDLVQRIIPRAVEDAFYTSQPLNISHLASACQTISPTPEFQHNRPERTQAGAALRLRHVKRRGTKRQ